MTNCRSVNTAAIDEQGSRSANRFRLSKQKSSRQPFKAGCSPAFLYHNPSAALAATAARVAAVLRMAFGSGIPACAA